MLPSSLHHILIIAAVPEERQQLRRLLGDTGLAITRVDEAGRAEDALALCRAERPDAVLLDLHPPDLALPETLAALRALHVAPVVLLADPADEERAAAAVAGGADDYLLNGAFSPTRLRLTLQRALVAAAAALGEQPLLLALEAARVTTWEWDLPGGAVTYLARAGNAFHLPAGPRASTIDALRAAVYPPDRPAHDAQLAAALAAGGPFQLTVRVLTPEGRLCWHTLSGLVSHDRQGRPSRVVGFTRDVSVEQRHALSDTLHVALNRALARELDVEATLELFCRLVISDLGDYGAIYLPDEAAGLRPALVFAGHLAEPAPLAEASDDAIAPLVEALREGRPRILSAAAPELAPVLGPLPAHATLLIPLVLPERVLGLIRVGITISARRYDGDDLALAEGLAKHMAEALNQARLREDARQARHIAAVTASLLDAIVASAPSGIGYLDQELRYRLVNPALAALNGRPPAEHLGRTLAEVLPEQAQRFAGLLRQVLATGKPLGNLELVGQPRAEGEEPRALQLNCFPVSGPSGAPTGVGIILTDITERRQIARTLERERQQLATILQTLDTGVVAVQPDGVLAWANAAAQLQFGIEPPPKPSIRQKIEPSSIPPFAMYDAHGSLIPFQDIPVIRVLRGERFYNQEIELRLHDQTEGRWFAVSAAPVYDVEGNVILGMVAADDITQRRRDATALAAHAENLSRVNADLARALRLKDEFLAMMSHELRTPLNVVLGLAEALEEGIYGPLSEQQAEALATVIQGGRHLLAIISDILDLTQLEAGAAPLELQAVDVDLLCRAAIQFVQAAAQQKQIRLLRVVENDVAGLLADERRLTQILVNLLDNAVKFTPAGGTVRLEVLADAGQERIQFTVSDTGIGIAEGDYERLFQPFTQVDGRLSRPYGGIGLGLTLVRRLVELHGGSIILESEPGQGSRFTVSLPWAPDDNVVTHPPRPALPHPAGLARPFRVVLADDHELTLTSYDGLLARQGYQVTLARNGVEAVAQVRATRPDVAVLDIQMPELDGLAAIRQIRADPELKATPIIALTALAMPGDRERCLEAGANIYLAKPVCLRVLLAAIGSVLASATPDGR